MGVGNLPYICEQLMKYGRPESTPVALVHWGTTEAQQTITGTLATIVEIARKSEIKNPSMIVVGEVVKLREKIQWFEQTELQKDSDGRGVRLRRGLSAGILYVGHGSRVSKQVLKKRINLSKGLKQ